MRSIIHSLFCLCLLAAQAAEAIGQSKHPVKAREPKPAEIGLMVARHNGGDDETFNPAVRLNGDALIEVQPTAEFSRGLAEALVERLQAAAAFAVYEPDAESNEVPDGVDYVVKARVIAVSLSAQHGHTKANKLCRLVKCPSSLRETVSRIRLSGEQVSFTVKVSLSAAAADTKRIVFAESFTGTVTLGAGSLADAEGDFGMAVLKSPAVSDAAHRALDQAVAALARRLAAE